MFLQYLSGTSRRPNLELGFLHNDPGTLGKFVQQIFQRYLLIHLIDHGEAYQYTPHLNQFRPQKRSLHRAMELPIRRLRVRIAFDQQI